MLVNTCPCCGSLLLRHARRQGVYWYCTSCHQEMIPSISGELPIYPEPLNQRLHSAAIKGRSHTLQSVKS